MRKKWLEVQKAWENVSKVENVWDKLANKSMWKCADAYNSIPKYAKVYQGMPSYAKVYDGSLEDLNAFMQKDRMPPQNQKLFTIYHWFHRKYMYRQRYILCMQSYLDLKVIIETDFFVHNYHHYSKGIFNILKISACWIKVR